MLLPRAKNKNIGLKNNRVINIFVTTRQTEAQKLTIGLKK